MSKIVRIDDKKAAPYRIDKPILLYVALAGLFVVTIVSLFMSNFSNFFVTGISFLMMMGSVWLISAGIRQKNLYTDTVVTRAPNVHYLFMGALALGTTTSFLSFFMNRGFFLSIFIGILATVGSLLYYGRDPKKDKTDHIEGISADLVISTIGEANTKISDIESVMGNIKDPTLTHKLTSAVSKAKKIIGTIEKDPKDIRVVRKFLIVYIDGVKDVVDSYGKVDSGSINSETRKSLYELFEEVDGRFDEELERLRETKHFDLDVKIDTLKEQIKH